MKRTILQASLLAIALVSSAHAHRSWLLPTSAHVKGKTDTVSVDAVASEELFEFEHALALGQVLVLSPTGEAQKPAATNAARHRNSLDVKLSQPGTYRISNLGGGFNASYKFGGETKRLRGNLDEIKKGLPSDATEVRVSQSVMRSETFVSKDLAGIPAFVPSKDGIEVQALTNVTDLSDGDSVRLRVLADGKPLPDATLTLIKGGNRYRYKLGEMTIKADANGEVLLTFNEAGRYWLGASHDVGTADGGTVDAPFKRYRYSLTFDIIPK